MTYRGTVKNGVVVFQGTSRPKDGTRVHVRNVHARTRAPRRGSPQAILACRCRWAGDPRELDRLLDEVQQMREEDVEAEAKTSGRNGQ